MYTLFAGLATSILGGLSKRKQAQRQNDALRAQFALNKSITQEGLSTLSYRTSIAESEAIRARVNRNIATKKAIRKTTGSAKVSAAQFGRAGKRVSLGLREASKEGANLISDSNINAQTELQNLTNQLNDNAAKMIQNLNNAAPSMVAEPSIGGILLDAGVGLVSSYTSMSPEAKAGVQSDISGLFKKAPVTDWGIDMNFSTSGAQLTV